MARVIRNYPNENAPIVAGGDETVPLIYFNLVRLEKGRQYEGHVPGFEVVCVVLSGACTIEVEGQRYDSVGGRDDIWSGKADSVYTGTGRPFRITAETDGVEVALAGGQCGKDFEPFRIPPDEVDMVDVGSNETKSRRRIYHVLGNKHADRAGNLLVSELYADEGCWSGYPPHKHDEDRGDTETAHEELYHFRYRPETGFGGQYWFEDNTDGQCFMMRNGDTFLLDKGFHPTVTSPGHEGYIFTILVGRSQRSLVQHFKEEHQHLMETIPGIAEMRAKFK
jgi:5-deoxy-glucuronate isomerase